MEVLVGRSDFFTPTGTCNSTQGINALLKAQNTGICWGRRHDKLGGFRHAPPEYFKIWNVGEFEAKGGFG